MTIHIDPRAIVHPTAKLADGVVIGPFAVIGEDVRLGERTTIGPHAVIERWTTIGARCRIGAGAVLGGDPQHQHYNGEPSYLRLGDDNDVRELVVIQRSAVPGGCTPCRGGRRCRPRRRGGGPSVCPDWRLQYGRWQFGAQSRCATVYDRRWESCHGAWSQRRRTPPRSISASDPP